MTYTEFVKNVKRSVFPDREASNLVANHSRYILDGLIEVQKRIPQLRNRNFNAIGFGDTFYQCRATVIDPKPDGVLIRLYTYTEPDHCDRVYYHPTTREHMESLMRSCGTGVRPSGPLVGPEPKDYFPALGNIPSATSTAASALDIEPIIGRIDFNPNILIGGSSATGLLELIAPAPVGGVTVQLSSANPLVVQVPTTVTIPFGERTVTYPIGTTVVEVSQTVMVTAALGSRTISLGLIVHDPNTETDKGYRAPSGYYAVIGSQVYVWPHLESNEHLVIEWSGIKTSYLPSDEVPFEVDVQSVVELYLQAQTKLREDCDLAQYANLQRAWLEQSGELAWWYRKKEQPIEDTWREADDCGCAIPVVASTGDGGGTTPPPQPGTFTVYLGNAGAAEPPGYTEAEILAMENGAFGIQSVRTVLTDTDYEIARPADQTNQFRLICIPSSVAPGSVEFRSAGFDLPMDELPPVSVNGVMCRVFRTSVISAGPFTKEHKSAITIFSS